jgi:hypothetical protein
MRVPVIDIRLIGDLAGRHLGTVHGDVMSIYVGTSMHFFALV